MQYLVTGTKLKENGKQLQAYRLFHCLADADEFVAGCNWQGIRIFGGSEVELAHGRENHDSALHRQGRKAAVVYLQANGYEVLKADFPTPYGETEIVARDQEDDQLVFAKVVIGADFTDTLTDSHASADERIRRERTAASFMRQYPEASEGIVRFDTIGIVVTSDRHALVRHHKNVMGRC